jgi:hypothetical protein
MRCSASPFELWNFQKTCAQKIQQRWIERSSEEREKGYCMYVIRSLFLNAHDVTLQLALGMSDCVFLRSRFPSKVNFTPKHEVQALSGHVIAHKGMPSPANRIQNQSPREWGDSCDSAQKGCSGIPSVSSLNLRGMMRLEQLKHAVNEYYRWVILINVLIWMDDEDDMACLQVQCTEMNCFQADVRTAIAGSPGLQDEQTAQHFTSQPVCWKVTYNLIPMKM